MFGYSKKILRELFGSGEEAAQGRRVLRVVKWGAVFVTFTFVLGFLLVEMGLGLNVAQPEQAPQQNTSNGALDTVEKLMSGRRPEIERAMANGTIDAELRKRNVPEKMRQAVKDEISRQMQDDRATSPR